ncbi:MAG: hypothetical protein ABR559_04400, partial [Gemmatimonadota bacterium]
GQAEATDPPSTDLIPPDSSPSAGDTTAPAGLVVEWIVGIVDRPRPASGVVVQTGLREARQEFFDRVVWEFAGPALPGYHIEYVDRPVRQCGSGEVVPLAGDGWLQVRFQPAYAHDDAGHPTVADRERAPGLPNLKEIKLICDFEADVEWILGVASPNRYRVMELTGPTRLVVDIQH